VISEHRPTTVVKLLEIAFFNNGANLRKLIDKPPLTDYPEKMKLYYISEFVLFYLVYYTYLYFC
jgi:hypothetical protein